MQQRKKGKGRFTKAQRDWLTMYQRITTFEPLLGAGETFDEIADVSVRWFEDWTTEAYLRISREIPYKREAGR